MSERPIIMRAESVRAILAGTKTMTRRIVARSNSTASGYKSRTLWDALDFSGVLLRDGKPNGVAGLGCGEYLHAPKPDDESVHRVRCDIEPGDRLWVREAWRTYGSLDHLPPRDIGRGAGVEYIAGGSNVDGHEALLGMGRYRHARFMPRRASRITLEVTGVRVERLDEITEEDARAEGALFHDGRGIGHFGWRHDEREVYQSARGSFCALWAKIHGPDSWDSRPWVWVIEFRRVGRDVASEVRA